MRRLTQPGPSTNESIRSGNARTAVNDARRSRRARPRLCATPRRFAMLRPRRRGVDRSARPALAATEALGASPETNHTTWSAREEPPRVRAVDDSRSSSVAKCRISTRPLKQSISPAAIRSTRLCDVHTARLTASAETTREICCRVTGLRISPRTFSAVSDARRIFPGSAALRVQALELVGDRP